MNEYRTLVPFDVCRTHFAAKPSLNLQLSEMLECFGIRKFPYVVAPNTTAPCAHVAADYNKSSPHLLPYSIDTILSWY